MKSNSNNVCLDPSRLTMASIVPVYKFFQVQSGRPSKFLIGFKAGNLPDDNSNDPDKIWRIYTSEPSDDILGGKLAASLKPFAERSSGYASMTTVIYANEINGNKALGNYDGAPIADFMTDIAQMIATHLEPDRLLSLMVCGGDATVESFVFDRERQNLVSAPISSRLYPVVKSYNGLGELEDYLTGHTNRFRDAKYQGLLTDYIEKTEIILEKAGLILTDKQQSSDDKSVFSQEAGKVCENPVQRADELLNLIRNKRQEYSPQAAPVKARTSQPS